MSFIEIKSYLDEGMPESQKRCRRKLRVDHLQRAKTEWLLTLNPNEGQGLADFFHRVGLAGGSECYFLRKVSETNWIECRHFETFGDSQIVFYIQARRYAQP